MRFFAALLLVLTLSGCGMAVSEKPMLSEADTVGAPQFENGVWLMPEKDEDGRCAVDTAQRVSTWPRCAGWAVHRDGQWFERDGETGIATKRAPVPLVIAGGDIAIVQIEVGDKEEEAATGGAPADLPGYFFAAFENGPVSTASKLRSVNAWIVMCGTYKPTEQSADDGTPRELMRFDGFDEECRPASVAAIRAAAAASCTPTAEIAHFQWVRAELD